MPKSALFLSRNKLCRFGHGFTLAEDAQPICCMRCLWAKRSPLQNCCQILFFGRCTNFSSGNLKPVFIPGIWPLHVLRFESVLHAMNQPRTPGDRLAPQWSKQKPILKYTWASSVLTHTCPEKQQYHFAKSQKVCESTVKSNLRPTSVVLQAWRKSRPKVFYPFPLLEMRTWSCDCPVNMKYLQFSTKRTIQ